MKISDKYGIFKECGFKDHHMLLMPAIHFEGYDKVMDYCYAVGKTEGYSEGSLFGAASEELYKKIKDLETANARLFERNHELQVDNEESLKEVEEYAKRNNELRAANDAFVKRFQEYIKIIEELQETNTGLTIGMESLKKDKAEFDRMKTGSSKSKFVITVEEF